MSFAVQFYFDLETEAAILGMRDKLLRRGIHAIPDEMRSRPHLTLGMWNGKTPVSLVERLEQLAASTPSAEVLFSSAGVFPTREGIIFLAPVVTVELLNFHARFHTQVVPPGLEADRTYLPGSWVPHVTLANYLADWEMHAAIDMARETPMPIHGRMEELGVIEYPPVKEIGRARMKDER